MTRKSVIALLAVLAALPGCISLGTVEPPEQLLTLTPTAAIAAGTSSQGVLATALAVQVPGVHQALNVNRIPVITSDSSLAYLANTFWVEKPANLFRNVLAETIRARGTRLVLGGGELEHAAETQLGGQLVEMGFDAVTGSAVVRYDAVLELPDGTIRTRRFEQRVAGVPADGESVGAALNAASNALAAEVADWVG